MLLLSASIAGGLYDILPGIDRRNASLVVNAIAHAAGLADPETSKQNLNGVPAAAKARDRVERLR